MSSFDQFVNDVKAADPTLVGESDKDKAEIQKLSGEVEGLSKDLPVSCLFRARDQYLIRTGFEREAHSFDLPLLEPTYLGRCLVILPPTPSTSTLDVAVTYPS